MPYTRSISIVRLLESLHKNMFLYYIHPISCTNIILMGTKKNEGLLLLAISFMVFSTTVVFYLWVKVAKLN